MVLFDYDTDYKSCQWKMLTDTLGRSCTFQYIFFEALYISILVTLCFFFKLKLRSLHNMQLLFSLLALKLCVCRGKEGRELLEECLVISEKHKGKEDPSSVTHLINLATSHSRSKNYVEAERVLRTSLQVLEKTVAPDDQSITFPMLHLAVTLYHLKCDEEAEQLALQALHIREKAFGKDSHPVGTLLFS